MTNLPLSQDPLLPFLFTLPGINPTSFASPTAVTALRASVVDQSQLSLNLALAGPEPFGRLVSGPEALTTVLITPIPDRVDGTAGADTLYGNDGYNIIHGRAGNDLIYATDGTDAGPGTAWIYGGDGRDEIYGGGQNDTLSGGDGDDYIATEVIYGGAAADLCFGGAGNDTVMDTGIDTGADTFHGGVGNDRLYGTGGGDLLYGGWGQDVLYAGSLGSSEMYGGAGNDSLQGFGDGGDRLTGGTGADTIQGFEAADVFVYTTAADSGVGLRSDVLSLFQSETDKIDLSAVAPNLVWIGDARFDGHAGQVRYVATTGFLTIDLDGDSTGDFRIILADKGPLLDSDLLL